MDKNFDIEHFPKDEAAQRMISRVSPIYEKSYVGKWLFEVMGIEMNQARQLVESLREQCFLEYCTWGMRYWEQRYGIEPDESKDLETRRAAVMAKRGQRGSMTPAALEEILEALTGRNVTVDEDGGNYSFKISIDEGTNVVDYLAVIKKTDTVKPSHLGYTIELPRKGTLTLHIGVASYQEKSVTISEFDQSGISDITLLVDEDDEYLCDEDGNIFIDEE